MKKFFEVPEKMSDAREGLRIKSLEAENVARKIVETWKSGYEKFWMTPRTHGDSARSMEELQAEFAVDPTMVVSILTKSAEFIAGVAAINPDHVGDDELLPVRYLSAPYEMEGLTLLKLKDEWKVQEEEE